MVVSETISPELRGAAWPAIAGWLSRVEPWTDDRPDPGHWLATTGLERARGEVAKALRAGLDRIVVSGPTGHGKTLLLRSLRTRPPGGLAPIFVPFSNVEPDDLAGWILEAAHQRLDRGPAARLVHLLRANARFGRGTLLLMDEVQATSCATLSRLFAIIHESDVAVSVVLAGLPGEALDLALTAVQHSTRKIEVCVPWSRADAALLLARVARELRIDPAGLIAEVDLDAALNDGAGNPRLVRAALAARLRAAELARERRRVAPFPCAQPSAQLAAPAPLDCARRVTETPILSPQAPAAARSRRTPSPGAGGEQARVALVRRSRGWRTMRSREWIAASWRSAMQVFAPGCIRLRQSLATRVRGAQAWVRRQARVAVARRSLGWRTMRSREWIAASWRSALQLFAPECIRLRQILATRARGVQAWLDRAAWRARVASRRAVRSIGTHGHRMGIAARARTHALSAGFRSRSLGCGEALWKAAREWARQVQATAPSDRLALDRVVLPKLTAAAQLLRRVARLPPVTARFTLAIGGAIAALAAFVAAGPMRAPVLTEVSEIGNQAMAIPGTPPMQAPALTEASQRGSAAISVMAVEPIPFRMNSRPWATVAIDGVEAGTTPFTIPLEPGPHHFRVAMADGRIQEQIFVVSAKQDRLAFR